MKKPSFRVLLGYGVWSVSITLGIIASYIIVWILLDTTIERFGSQWFILLALSIMSISVIWLDYLLNTQILAD